MFPGVNAKQMRQAMKQLGIKQDDLPASEVIIRLPDREIVINDPSVQRINMQGQISFQVSGEVSERSIEYEAEILDEDVQAVIEQTGVSEDVALSALKETKGDLAEAILKLNSENEED